MIKYKLKINSTTSKGLFNFIPLVYADVKNYTKHWNKAFYVCDKNVIVAQGRLSLDWDFDKNCDKLYIFGYSLKVSKGFPEQEIKDFVKSYLESIIKEINNNEQ